MQLKNRRNKTISFGYNTGSYPTYRVVDTDINMKINKHVEFQIQSQTSLSNNALGAIAQNTLHYITL